MFYAKTFAKMLRDICKTFLQMFSTLNTCWRWAVVTCKNIFTAFLGRLLLRCLSIRPTYVRPSTKSFSDSNEIWYIGIGRWVMHDGKPCGSIQGQGQGHVRWKVAIEILPFSKSTSSAIFNESWQMTADSLNGGHYCSEISCNVK